MLQCIIGSIVHWLQPLVAGTFLNILMISQMLEPGATLGTVPMLHFGRNGDDGAGSHLLRLLAPFMIPAMTGNADEHLHLLVVDVPIVAATGLEGDIHHTATDICQITLTNEILAVRIMLTLGPLA